MITGSPSPSRSSLPPLEERSPESLSAEEARELVRRMRERQKEQDFIKSEIKQEDDTCTILADDSDIEELGSTGDTPAPRRIQQSSRSGAVVIDLTDD